MSGGDSAAREARNARAIADEMRRQAHVYEQMAFKFEAAAASEHRLEQTLAPLQSQGFHVLPDRRWPGSTRAQVDFVVVGPSGVFIVDAKTWKDVRIEKHGPEHRVYQGDDDVTDRFAGLADLGVTTEQLLAEIGLAPTEVHTLAVFTNRRDIRAGVMGVELMSEGAVVERILSRGRRLSQVDVERVLVTVMTHFPPYTAGAGAPSVIVTAPPAPARDEPVELLTVAEINAAAFEGLSREPIESWMAFLHPEQAKVVRRTFNGPCRIRGAAGTGKTVVGLHRAAHIARTRPGKVLVTTYVRTLPDVLGALFERLAPEVADRVDFEGIHALAGRILKSRDVRYTLDGRKAKAAWERIWRAHGSAVAAIDPDERYWREEIASVIKGRGLSSLAEYENCARVGRQRALGVAQRAAVWTLYEHYAAELRRIDVWDFEDLILAAEASLRHTPLEEYSAVVIDEAQDLSCAMIRMLHLLVGDGPDAFNLIGDGQQSIYPGGYTLSELGISIAGRGVVMDRNYRNTLEIAQFASSIVRENSFVDIESGARGTADAAEFLRRGAKPKVVRFSSKQRHDVSVVDHVRSLLEDPSVALGDIGVLAMYRYHVTDLLTAFRAAGIPAVDLENYDGRPTQAVKVGTIKRAKGLEFKFVIVARTPLALIDGMPPGRLADSERERLELELRELYVAMTRARDGLWVGVLAA
ncbi:UvrD-helicase domain-containing protein [Protaetiibacter sp. SSC-01]|uniref:nuclease-related domain-containing DEAD/DEAH box helicase n=1 Tax=Protaetiibacter sp. SSC-01 TaxID=2759943 RepID=UPI001656C5D0|nr:UvrD-helicase domain-containing protein [Protaetiibacter sp. SSC-01]QNO38384.1 UvrD-helicase domain-containing protein [Protaetiibacter sp. SSC-01]